MPTPPDKVGEYTIEQELGRGGMGVVQLAHHPRHGEVALKRLLDKPHAFALRSLRTEIHLLSALDHPGVVRLIDHGIEERGPWMAMEHVSGRPLSDYLHALGQEGTAGLHTSRHGLGLSTTAEQQSTAALTEEQQHTVALTAEQDLKRPTASEQYTAALHAASTLPASEQRPLAIPRPALEPVSKAQVAQWIYQVCQALAYIHGQGIVHADVKPGNILIDTSGRPVLVDFGIATRFGSRVEVDTMRRAGVLAGSLSTISPEQCRGASLDARTDLYAIGCVLFELLAGRPPFVLQDGEPSTALMDKHMHQAPPSLEALGVVLPPLWQGLASTLEGLLTKARHTRTGYARKVLRTLEQTQAIAPSLRVPDARPYLHKPALIGRQSVLNALLEALKRTQNEQHGGLILLGGISGMGKTRLSQEMVRRARGLHALVFVGYSSHGIGQHQDRPLALFVPILRELVDRCIQVGAAYAANLFSPIDRAILRPYAPFLDQLPGQTAQEVVLAELPVEHARLRLFAHLTGVLERATEERLTLFVLDDLHWADELSLGALEFMAQELEYGSRWLFVGNYRSEELPGSSLEAMIDHCPCELLTITRLDRKHVGDMIGQMLGQTPPQALVDAVANGADGNPFAVAEYLYTATASNRLTLSPEGRWDWNPAADATLPEPDSIQALIKRRLERLTSHALHLTQVAAVLGKRMDAHLLRDLSGLAWLQHNNALEELQHVHILERDPTTERLQFVHDKLRESAYAQTDPDTQRAIHRNIAQHLEAQKEGYDPATTAVHWEQGGHPIQARTRYIEAARHDAERWAIQDAQHHLRAALNLNAAQTAQDDLVLRLETARLSRLVGAHDASAKAAEEVLALLQHHAPIEDNSPTHRLTIQAHLDAAESLEQLARLEQAHQHVHHASRLMKTLADPLRHQARIAFLRGRLMAAEGDTQVSQSGLLFEQAAQYYAQLGDIALQARCIMESSDKEAAQGHYEEVKDRCLQALALYNQVEDAHGEALCWTQLGLSYITLSHYDKAHDCYTKALELHRKTGNGKEEAQVLYRIGGLLDETGRHHEARRKLLQAFKIMEQYGTRRWHVMNSIAINHIYLGKLREGSAWMEQARLQAEREKIALSTSMLANRAYIAVCWGDRAKLAQIVDEMRAFASPDEPNSFANVVLFGFEGQLSKLNGDLAHAETFFWRYHDILVVHNRPTFILFARIDLIRLAVSQQRIAEAQTLLDDMPSIDYPDGNAATTLITAFVRRHQGRLHEAQVCADEALNHYKGNENLLNLLLALCERTLIAHALDEPVEPWLEQLRDHSQGFELYPRGDLSDMLHAVMDAIPEANLPVIFLDD